MSDWPERLNRFIESLGERKRPERGLARSIEELEEMRLAARLAGTSGDPEPDPAFLADLRKRLGIISATSRRTVSRVDLLRLAAAWLAGAAAGFTGGIFRPAPPPSSPVSPAPVQLADGRWFPVASLANLSVDAVEPVEAGAVPAFVLREQNTVRALSRVCTHMGCLLTFDNKEREFYCPCHGAVFGLDGNLESSYEGGPLPPLPRLAVRVEKGTVFVRGA
jgi:Rieske Fe-S protein